VGAAFGGAVSEVGAVGGGPPLRITSRVIVEVGRSRRLAISA
jgi:hypothetical protein